MASDVTIIGAGPAGSAAAILLARQGWAVTLIEQHRFPRDKVCGECLSTLGIEVLGRMGLIDDIRRLEPTVLQHAAIHTPTGVSTVVPMRRPMWGLSRHAFDQFMREAAREAGAKVLQPARCESIEPGLPIVVRIRVLASNEIRVLRSEHVIVADGKSGLLGQAPPRTNDFGIKAHFVDVDGPRDTIELFGCDALYGGLAAIESDRWNAAFSVPAWRLRRHRGDLGALFAEITTENPILARRLKSARQIGGWLAAPLPRFGVRDSWPAGVVPVGNAAAALEPIGGEGMGLALASAEHAAASLTSADPYSHAHVLSADYHRLWRVRRPACRAAAQIISRPELATALTPLLTHLPFSRTLAMRLLGK
jgi:flavin-dependent dehydrogenase